MERHSRLTPREQGPEARDQELGIRTQRPEIIGAGLYILTLRMGPKFANG